MRGGRVLLVDASDFASKDAPSQLKEAQYEYLINLPTDIASASLTNQSSHTMNSLGELMRIFNNSALDEVSGDFVGRIYEYFLKWDKQGSNIACGERRFVI